MSLEIFERAKKKADKIIEIYRVHGLCKERLNKSYISINSYRFHEKTIYMNSGYFTTVYLNIGNECYNNREHYKFDGTGTNYKHPTIDKRLIHIEEFQEDLDFQLMTLFTDNELLEYYYCSLIYSSGFIGSVRRSIHHISLNKMIEHINRINEHKDSTSYEYTRSTW